MSERFECKECPLFKKQIIRREEIEKSNNFNIAKQIYKVIYKHNLFHDEKTSAIARDLMEIIMGNDLLHDIEVDNNELH